MPKKGKEKISTKTPQFSADTIILGFTGSIGSGCTYISDDIAKSYNYKKYSLSKVLRAIAKEKAIQATTENLQNIGNELREKDGNSALVVALLDSINESDVVGHNGIIIDSIRNDGEVHVLKQFPNFYLFSIHADKSTRRKRCVRKKRRFRSNKEFDEADERDRAEDFSHGQQVEKCNDLADIIINNSDDIPSQNNQRRKKFIDKIYNDYVLLIETKTENPVTPDRLPSVNETLMTMAYAESQRSSCLKRKVGCIIATHSQHEGEEMAILDSVQVISTGHNEVPTGSIPCIFHSDYEKCYRDHLQEIQAVAIKHCPNCGKKISLPSTKCNKCNKTTRKYIKVCPKCKSEVKVKHNCPKCNTDIFKEYLLGTSRLLDMCRSLHAEENALISLTKVGSLNSDNVVLYTTTYPCNLCANKIVSAGIKKVVYADPYPMDAAKHTLETASVKTEKFEGIKSSAYFRLYR